MDKYLKNLLPRLKQYGQKLNKIESFVDKIWVLYDDMNGFQTFRFLRNGKLLITVSGMVEEHHWEYLAPDSLYIKRDRTNGIMYRQAFFLDSLFIMQVEGAVFEPVLFYNEAEIPDGNVINYLKNIYISKNSLRKIGTQGKYYHHYENGITIGSQILNEDFEVVLSKKIAVDNKEITISNGKIESIIYTYKIGSDSGVLNVKSRTSINDLNGITVGAEVRYGNNNLASGIFKIDNNNGVKRIHVDKGIVIKVVHEYQIALILLLSFFLFLIIVGIYYYNTENHNPQEEITTIIEPVAADTTVSPIADSVVAPVIYDTTVAPDSYSLFDMTESTAKTMDLKVYLELIFSKLHYIGNNYPNEANKYKQAAIEITTKPIYIYHENEYVTFNDFINEGGNDDLSLRVSEVENLRIVDESYYVILNYFHV
jgi:hypothetical protein